MTHVGRNDFWGFLEMEQNGTFVRKPFCLKSDEAVLEYYADSDSQVIHDMGYSGKNRRKICIL